MAAYSKNALAQAIRKLDPGVTRSRLMRLLHVPETITTHNRYWSHTYNILPWNQRTSGEQEAALAAATKLLGLNLMHNPSKVLPLNRWLPAQVRRVGKQIKVKVLRSLK